MASSNQSNRSPDPDFQSGRTNFIIKKTGKNKIGQGVEVNALLRSQIAHLWPAINNITACQKDCVTALPQLFMYCQVLHLDADQLTVAAPNSALASKLKQLLPKLLSALQKAGWQINAIRIKVQVNPTLEKEPVEKQCRLSGRAIAAFGELEKNLAGSKHNEGLLEALRNLINRRR